MDVIRDTCPRTLLLRSGRVVAIGPTDDVVTEYERSIGVTARKARPAS